jgi:hypothetical protein
MDNTDATVLEVVSTLNAKVAVYYYMKLLQSEFERQPDSKTVRDLIAELYQSQAFQALSAGVNPEEEFHKLFDYVQNINESYLRDPESRPKLVENRLNYFNKIPGFEKRD